MNILELFAGTCTFTNVAKSRGHNTFSIDILPLQGIDLVCNVLDFNPEQVPFTPHLIWLSPDCAPWSRASGNFHFAPGLTPKTEKAALAFEIIEKCLSIIAYYQAQNPNLIYYIENPVGRLQYYLKPNSLLHPISVPRLIRIDQCAYNRQFKKPTHLWTNDLRFTGKKCTGQRCNHDREGLLKKAGDGRIRKKNTTEKGYFNRAKLPELLCLEVIQSVENQLEKGIKTVIL